MSDDDFNIESLAAFLHVAPAQVHRLVERGKLPGRKVAGQWRFSQAEIHHWLEERIGLSTDEQLQQMEGALDRASGPAGETPVSLSELLPLEAIAIPLAARTRGSVITSLVDVAAQTGWLWDPVKMADAVRAREDLLPTALEGGMALLHPRRPMPAILAQPFIAFGRTVSGIPFGGPRGSLTDLFFLILSTDDRGHLRVLARLSRLLGDSRFVDALRAAEDAPAVRAFVAEAEDRLT
jgi:PTS system nitrogen regulatory IIA component